MSVTQTQSKKSLLERLFGSKNETKNQFAPAATITTTDEDALPENLRIPKNVPGVNGSGFHIDDKPTERTLHVKTAVNHSAKQTKPAGENTTIIDPETVEMVEVSTSSVKQKFSGELKKCSNLFTNNHLDYFSLLADCRSESILTSAQMACAMITNIQKNIKLHDGDGRTKIEESFRKIINNGIIAVIKLRNNDDKDWTGFALEPAYIAEHMKLLEFFESVQNKPKIMLWNKTKVSFLTDEIVMELNKIERGLGDADKRRSCIDCYIRAINAATCALIRTNETSPFV